MTCLFSRLPRKTRATGVLFEPGSTRELYAWSVVLDGLIGWSISRMLYSWTEPTIACGDLQNLGFDLEEMVLQRKLNDLRWWKPWRIKIPHPDKVWCAYVWVNRSPRSVEAKECQKVNDTCTDRQKTFSFFSYRVKICFRVLHVKRTVNMHCGLTCHSYQSLRKTENPRSVNSRTRGEHCYI